MDTAEILQLQKELCVPEIPVQIDLSPYLKVCANNPKMRIGFLNSKIDGLTSYKKGDMVLFTPYTVEEEYGKHLWEDLKKHVQLCTIEVPASLYFKDNKCLSIKCMVCVPQSYIGYEIKIK